MKMFNDLAFNCIQLQELGISESIMSRCCLYQLDCLVLGMHTQCNTTKDQDQAQPGLFGNDLALDIPFSKYREQKGTRVGQRHSKGEF
jgi:hypothetical protein